MANIPDLDTANISFVAYWNAIDDGGVSSIDPEGALSSNNISSYELYDNGVEGKYQKGFPVDTFDNDMSTTDRVNFRVKSDGWIVTWLDRTEEYGANTLYDVNNGEWDPLHGPWDIIYNWHNTETVGQFSPNRLELAIQDLQSQLSKSDGISFNLSDVGLYNYEYPDATTTSWFGLFQSLNNDTQNSATGGLSYTSSTTLYDAYAAGINGPSNSTTSEVGFEGKTVAGTSDRRQGAINLIDDGLISQPGTEYQMSGSNRDYGSYNGNVLIVWG